MKKQSLKTGNEFLGMHIKMLGTHVIHNYKNDQPNISFVLASYEGRGYDEVP